MHKKLELQLRSWLLTLLSQSNKHLIQVRLVLAQIQTHPGTRLQLLQ